MPAQPITLLIADAHTIIRHGLAATISKTKNIEIAAIAGNTADLESLCRRHQPDVVMIGAAMQDGDKQRAYRHIAREFPYIPMIIIVEEHDAETIISMKTTGQLAWLYKSATEEEITNTISAVHEGTWRNKMYNGYTTNVVKAAPTELFTPREIELLPFFCQDLTAREIGAIKNLSRRTVENYKQTIMQKLQVKGVGGMMLYAFKNNISIASILYCVSLLFSAGLQDGFPADIYL